MSKELASKILEDLTKQYPGVRAWALLFTHLDRGGRISISSGVATAEHDEKKVNVDIVGLITELRSLADELERRYVDANIAKHLSRCLD